MYRAKVSDYAWTIAELAVKIGMRRSSFYHRFKKLMGMAMPEIPRFCVVNLRNNPLLRAIHARNLNSSDTIYFIQNKSESP